ncbi:hypothetical protein CH35J_006390 [Colletotrichum higginsianum]|uniref:Uncharacterized protein n=1 Tax=Colletotrichum higginsianum TaxID=80884 RepID=A0A4T0W1D1_9PEZI|nr:hypothetical protein CH35J_006390 [Colletotrichum higginsianum]
MVGRVEKIANDYEWDASQISISQVAHRHASEILPGDVFRRSASSIEDFICGIKPIFCSSITQQIRLNLDNFDAVAGIECTEAFLGKKTIGDWLLHIITEFLKPLTVSLSASSFSKSSSPAVAVTNPNKAPLANAPVEDISDKFNVPIDRTVQQVILRGRTVLEAWTTTPTTRQLSMMKEDQKRLHHDPENLNPAWTPRQAGSSPVYHGSIVSNPHWALQFTNNPFDALDARTNANQMVTDAFGVIFTTFSPLRAFL